MADFGSDVLSLSTARNDNDNDNDRTPTQYHDMNLSEKEAFDAYIRPNDSYTPDGVYWADLPLLRRIAFVSKYDAAETSREFASFWKMFKNDPLAPVGYYFKNMVLPGAGLGLEG